MPGRVICALDCHSIILIVPGYIPAHSQGQFGLGCKYLQIVKKDPKHVKQMIIAPKEFETTNFPVKDLHFDVA